MNPTTEKKPNTLKVIIFVAVLVSIIIIIYYLYCHYAGDDEDGFNGGSSVTVGWNIEDMVEKIHHRQRTNLSRLSKDAQYNF